MFQACCILYLDRKTQWNTIRHGFASQSLDLNITKAMWRYLERERNKRLSTSKLHLWKVLWVTCWRTIPQDYFWEFKLCWRITVVIPNTVFTCMFGHVALNHCTYCPAFLAKCKGTNHKHGIISGLILPV